MRKEKFSSRKPGGSRDERSKKPFSKSNDGASYKGKSTTKFSDKPSDAAPSRSPRTRKSYDKPKPADGDTRFARSRRDSNESKNYEKKFTGEKKETYSSERGRKLYNSSLSERSKFAKPPYRSNDSSVGSTYNDRKFSGDKRDANRTDSEKKPYAGSREGGRFNKPTYRGKDNNTNASPNSRNYSRDNRFTKDVSDDKKPYRSARTQNESNSSFGKDGGRDEYKKKNYSSSSEGEKKYPRSNRDTPAPNDSAYSKSDSSNKFNDKRSVSYEPQWGAKKSFRKDENTESKSKPERKKTDNSSNPIDMDFDFGDENTPPIKSDETFAQSRDKTGGRPVRKSEDMRSSASKYERKEKHEFYGDKKKYANETRVTTKPVRERNTIDRDENFSKELAGDNSTRLNKYISNAGVCSRREADELIEAGTVTVNGEVITTLGYKIKPGDVVKHAGQTLKNEQLVYLLLNKPKDFITTMDDPQDRNTVMSLISGACKERVYPVGRLDRNTSGLLLFTNDGELADRLMHPSFEAKKIYHIEIDKNLKPEHFKALSEGVELEDGTVRVDDIAFIGDGFDKRQIGVELHSGRNRIVRRMFEHFGYVVKKLDRTYYAGLGKKDLGRGRHRFLTAIEVGHLKMLTADKKVKKN